MFRRAVPSREKLAALRRISSFTKGGHLVVFLAPCGPHHASAELRLPLCHTLLLGFRSWRCFCLCGFGQRLGNIIKRGVYPVLTLTWHQHCALVVGSAECCLQKYAASGLICNRVQRTGRRNSKHFPQVNSIKIPDTSTFI